MFRQPLLLVSAFLAVLGGIPATGSSQVVATQDGGIQLSRDALQERLTRYEQAAGSSAYSPELRSHAREEAELIRGRLAGGDLKVGDQIALRVEGEEELTETFLVTQGPALELPTIGTVSLEGVLRSELESHLTTELARFIREPRVQARALFRITITGAVGRPGFYVVPAEILLTDALMTAGGPAQRAKLEKIRIERAGEPIWEGEAMQQAITEGRTLDALSLQAGDVVVVPEDRGGNGELWRYALTGISSVILAISAASRIF